MRHVSIWGSAGGLGAAVIDHLFEAHIPIAAIGRDPDRNPMVVQRSIRSIICDATNKKEVENAVEQLPVETVHISTMGSFACDQPVDYIGHRHLIDAMEHHGHRRLMLITSLGCGDSWRYLSERSKQSFGAAVREKSLAESWLKSSSLDYTILRPGGLKDGGATRSGELSQNCEVHGMITRGEVARLIHELLLREDSIGEVYQCVDPKATLS